ncbi:MAG: peptidase M61 [Flavobacteriales bacterium]|nr:MAG: peptidase M61 [Flavobacteriales bacterium]
MHSRLFALIYFTYFFMKRLFFTRTNLFLLISIVILQGCASLNLASKKSNIIETYIDLNAVDNDQLVVSLNPGSFPKGEVTFYMPSVIPGTYEYTDFGRFVSNFKAFDKNNQLIDVVKEGKNTWKIAEGKKLDRVSYVIDDTFDSPEGKKIYPMGGTKIEKDEVFLLNLHGFVGYFKGGKEWSYRVTIDSPADLVPFSSLESVSHTATQDVFLAGRYFNIIDDPILYTNDDSISFSLEDIEVNLAVYSPTGAHKAADFKETIETMMQAQKRFLGDANATKSYDILLLLMSMEELQQFGGVQGALEHHTSTTVVFYEGIDTESLKEYLVDVVSHEFFHTLTPLNVHSEQIHYFNYNEGIMSQHLWMYEGTTEYFANLFQVQQELIDENDFYGRMSDKISSAKRYDDTMPFTVMSTNIVEEPYQSNYQNVYYKGALINMCLDIIIREQSGGARGFLDVMQALAKKYGVDTPFTDDKLFDEIIAMTYPEVGDFIKTYIQGETPIPYTEFLEKAGVTISETDQELPSIIMVAPQQPFIAPQPNEAGTRDLVVTGLNNRLSEIGFQEGDLLRVFNGEEIPALTQENMGALNNLFGTSFGWTADQEVTFEVERAGTPVTLSGTVGVAITPAKGISAMENATPAQMALRNVWLHGKEE